MNKLILAATGAVFGLTTGGSLMAILACAVALLS
jgi:hypothetical protein